MRLHGLIQRCAVTMAAAGLVFSAVSPVAAADNFASVLAKAKQEGVVIVHGGPGRPYEAALVTAFNKAYPDIKVRFSGAANAVEVPKVLRERQAGIYGWDVWVGGPSSMVGTLQHAGFFQPLQPILRPETMQNDKWQGGFAFGWMDKGQRLVYGFDGTIQNPVLINWDFVKKSSITSLMDLLKPEFAGKIVWHDPRVNGTGNGTSQTLLHNIGEKNLTALYKSKIVYTANPRQIAEWVVRGRYPISIGLESDNLHEFTDQGLGKNISPISDNILKVQQISTGFGGLGFVDHAPHPNAAAVYINWLLSKDGQEAYTKVPRNSRRTDVKPAFPELAPVAGKEYFVGQAEKFVEERQHLLVVAKQAIDGK